MDRKFVGYGPNWNRCECGHRLRRAYTPRGNLVHRHPRYGEREHDLVMRKKAEAAQSQHSDLETIDLDHDRGEQDFRDPFETRSY